MGRKFSSETRAKIGAKNRENYADGKGPMAGKQHTEETKAKMSVGAKKRGTNGVKPKWTAELRRKASASAKARGETHNFFVDGKGHERDTERRTAMKGVEYRLWREAVFSRDDWACQECGARGGKLVADHVQPWAGHPELRYDVGNGRTLCQGCHKKTPTYGRRSRKTVESNLP